MARTSLTAAFKASLLPPDCEEVGITLLTIAHPSFASTYYICDNNEDIVSNGQTYSAYGFDIALVDELEGEIPSQHFILDNTDYSIFQAIRSADSTRRITVTQQFVVASDPNTNLLMRTISYQCSEIEVDQETINGTLILAVIAHDSVPWLTASPAIWPGLFSTSAA